MNLSERFQIDLPDEEQGLTWHCTVGYTHRLAGGHQWTASGIVPDEGDVVEVNFLVVHGFTIVVGSPRSPIRIEVPSLEHTSLKCPYPSPVELTRWLARRYEDRIQRAAEEHAGAGDFGVIHSRQQIYGSTA